MNTSLKYTLGFGLIIGVIATTAYSSETVGQKLDHATHEAGIELKHESQKTERFVKDASITATVKTDIFKEPLLKSLKINVKTTAGVVTLAGFVSSQKAFDKASEIAKSVSGVKAVKNKLSIKPIG